MGSQLTENWNSLSEDEDEEEIVKRHERDLLIRQTEIEAHSEYPFTHKNPFWLGVFVRKERDVELQGGKMTD